MIGILKAIANPDMSITTPLNLRRLNAWILDFSQAMTVPVASSMGKVPSQKNTIKVVAVNPT